MKRALLVVLVLIVAVPLAAIAAASWLLSGDALKVRLVEQVRRATGRELTVAGPVGLAWSLSPTIAMADVSLSNPPGFSQGEMAHVARLEARVAIGPLFRRRVLVERLAIASPSIRLERNAAGAANWDFHAPVTPAAVPAAPSEPRGERFALGIGAIDINDATIAWGTQTVIAPHLAYDPALGHVDGTVAAAGSTFALAGHAGPIAAAAFPVDLRLTGSGLAATLAGTSAAAILTITASDVAALSALIGRPLPPIHDVALSTTLPGPGELRLQAGAAVIGPLTVRNALLTAASLSDRGVFTAAVSVGSLPFSLTGHVGSLAALLREPTPVDARMEAPGVVATAAGTLAVTGAADLQVTLHSPDLGLAGSQAGLRLPNFRGLDAKTGLVLSPGQVALRAFHLTSAQGDLGGDFVYSTAGRPALRGTLASTRLDLDALAPPPVAAPAPSPAPPTQPAPAPQPARLIPDTRLPVQALRAADADLNFSAASVHVSGATYGAVQAHALLQSGILHLDPVSTTLGTATAHATLQIDAAATPPGLHLTVDAPGLPFGSVLALLGKPSQSPGALDLRADLTGTGDTIRAVAATVTGHAGLAVTDGQIDNELLERLAAGALRSANIPVEAGGSTMLRCAAFRADAAAGQLQLSALTLDTSKLALDGGGIVNLRDETLDLRLRPQLRLGGGLSVPLRVRGTLAAPKVTLDPGAIASGRVGIVLGGGAPPDTCGPALALARDGHPGAAAAVAPPARPVKPVDLLRGLLR